MNADAVTPTGSNTAEWGGNATLLPALARSTPATEPGIGETWLRLRGRAGWLPVAAASLAACVVWALLPWRSAIPPQIEADYCYQLIAAERCFNGLGLTSLQPVAPTQPWDWQYEWGFLTQWPIGYPMLVCGVRLLTGCTTVAAAQWLAVIGCGLAVVGWFVLVRRMLVGGIASVLLAAAAALTSLEAGSILNPSTDTLLAGLLPFVLMAVLATVGRLRDRTPAHADPGAQAQRGTAAVYRFAACGLLAGGLFWLRYASVFVPAAVGLYLCWLVWRREGVRRRDVAAYAAGAALPIVALLIVNRAFAAGGSIQSQLNLGGRVGFALTPELPATAWWMLTDFGYYDYRPEAHMLLALAPLALLGAALLLRPLRHAFGASISTPALRLGAIVLAALLALLVASSALFGEKYNYVVLERYYLPVRPILLALLAAPLLMLRRRWLSAGVGLAAVIALSWTLRYDWHRAWTRWAAADRERAPSGAWAQVFEPGAAAMYAELARYAGDDVILFSNFHDYLAVELRVPAYPLPTDRPTAQRWISGIASARGRSSADVRAVFVIDPDNRWRDYYLRPPGEVIASLDLVPLSVGRPPTESRLWVPAMRTSSGRSDPAAQRTALNGVPE